MFDKNCVFNNNGVVTIQVDAMDHDAYRLLKGAALILREAVKEHIDRSEFKESQKVISWLEAVQSGIDDHNKKKEEVVENG